MTAHKIDTATVARTTMSERKRAAQGQCIRTAKSYKNHVYLICITKGPTLVKFTPRPTGHAHVLKNNKPYMYVERE